MPNFSFRTICIDLPDGFAIKTFCEVKADDGTLLASAETVDTTDDPVFARVLDKWLADPGVSPRWIATRILEVHREHTRGLSVAAIKRP